MSIFNKKIINYDVYINSYEDCERWIKVNNKNYVEDLYSKITSYIFYKKDFSLINEIINIIKKKSHRKRSNLKRFLNETKIIADDLKPSMKKRGLFNKEYFCNNPSWVNYFNSKDFAKYLKYCRKFKVTIMVFDK